MAALTKTERYWKILAFTMSVIAIVIVGLVGKNYYERAKVAAKPAAAISGKFLNISIRSKNDLVTFMKKEEAVIGVGTVSISLATNRRTSTFFQSENAGFQAAWEKNQSTRVRLPEVFSNKPYFNTRITKIINGNFECRKTADTLIATQYPAHDFAPIVCSISVPPGFDDSGDFVGYINFFLNGEPTDSEKARLAKEAVLLSSQIYRRDISPDSNK